MELSVDGIRLGLHKVVPVGLVLCHVVSQVDHNRLVESLCLPIRLRVVLSCGEVINAKVCPH